MKFNYKYLFALLFIVLNISIYSQSENYYFVLRLYDPKENLVNTKSDKFSFQATYNSKSSHLINMDAIDYYYDSVNYNICIGYNPIEIEPITIAFYYESEWMQINFNLDSIKSNNGEYCNIYINKIFFKHGGYEMVLPRNKSEWEDLPKVNFNNPKYPVCIDITEHQKWNK